MKNIYIDTYKGIYHPCQVECLKHNPLTNTYILYFFDRASNDYFYTNLIEKNGEFFCKTPSYRSERNQFEAISMGLIPKTDVSILPPVLKSIKHRKITNDDKFIKNIDHEAFTFIKKLEFLELESYANAVDGVKYYYFIVDDMEPDVDTFTYYGRLSEVSDKPLKKNIIARHKTELDISDYSKDNEVYQLSFDLTEEINVDLKKEKKIIELIKKSNNGERKDMDPVYLTKVVRSIMREEDVIKSTKLFDEYLVAPLRNSRLSR